MSLLGSLRGIQATHGPPSLSVSSGVFSPPKIVSLSLSLSLSLSSPTPPNSEFPKAVWSELPHKVGCFRTPIFVLVKWQTDPDAWKG